MERRCGAWLPSGLPICSCDLMSRLHVLFVATLLSACATVPAASPSLVSPVTGAGPSAQWRSTASQSLVRSETSPLERSLSLDSAPTAADGEHEPSIKDPWKSLACTQACEAGGEAMEAFCRALPDKTGKHKVIRQACWAASRASKGACVVFCNVYFGPPAKPNR